MEVYGVVYTLIDGTNDFEYVGQTTRSVEKRFKEHTNENTYIGRAIRDHGEDMFSTAILKECYSKEELDYWEKRLIKSRDTLAPNGYNLTEGGEGICGWKHTDEAKAKIGAANKGKQISEEACKKISIANTGKKHSTETIARMSEDRKGEKNAFFGKHHTDETRVIISVARRGKSPFKNLLKEIDARNLSYSMLEEILGLSDLSSKMRGKKNFTAEQIDKLVEFFGKPAEYLLARDDGLPFITSREELGAKSSAIRRTDSPYKNLICEMDKKNLSYAELAKLLGLCHQAVSMKMRGERKFMEKDIAKLVEFFGKPAEYLLERDDGVSAISTRKETPYKNLLAEIDAHNLSYAAIAKLLGLCHQVVSMKMRGKQNFTAEQIAKLVEFFGKPAEYLLARDDGVSAISTCKETPYKNLLAEIDAHNLSYAAIAKLLGLSQSTVSDKMRGKQNFTAEQIAKLVDFLASPPNILWHATTKKRLLKRLFGLNLRGDYNKICAEVAT